jgi:hypothetical protein
MKSQRAPSPSAFDARRVWRRAGSAALVQWCNGARALRALCGALAAVDARSSAGWRGREGGRRRRWGVSQATGRCSQAGRMAWWRTYHRSATEHLRQMATLGLLLQGDLARVVGCAEACGWRLCSKGRGACARREGDAGSKPSGIGRQGLNEGAPASLGTASSSCPSRPRCRCAQWRAVYATSMGSALQDRVGVGLLVTAVATCVLTRTVPSCAQATGGRGQWLLLWGLGCSASVDAVRRNRQV